MNASSNTRNSAPTRARTNTGPLAGMKVLELAQIMAGPTAGMMLADLGAEVIKVEKLPGGDDARNYREPRVNGESAPFMMLNRNKRGLALDLKQAAGKDVLKRMVKHSDVLIENYRRGAMEKLGLGYEVLSQINPGLIYSAVSGYGRTGPYQDKGGFDLIAQGFAGLMSITGEPGGAPIKTGNSVADINAGILAAVGVLAAWIHKLKTGEGQVVETSLMEAALQQTYWHAAIFFATGQSATPLGSGHVLTAPYQAFRTADGYINLGGANQANWERIAETLGNPQWKTDPRYQSNQGRMDNLAQLVIDIEAVLRTHSSAFWIERFDQVGVPIGPVHSIGEALTHPQVQAREMVIETEHPKAGKTRSLGIPIKMSRHRLMVEYPAPMLGQHSREILTEFGFDATEISALFAQRVVG
jgi:crotonobetainyl-CoA:carnitine CoA-transferase CaiB-like acyl-CoA transferase